MDDLLPFVQANIRPRIELDGQELYEWRVEDGVYYRRHISVNEAALMAENRERGQTRTLGFGRMFARLTPAQWGYLRKQFPALDSRDGREKARAWERLARDPDYAGIFVNRV